MSEEKQEAIPPPEAPPEIGAKVLAKEAKEISIADIVDPLAKNMPVPTGPLPPPTGDDFPANPPLPPGTVSQTPSPSDAPKVTDANGTVFDAAKHRTNPDGTPKLKNGVFVSTRGRKEGQTNSLAASMNNTGAPDEYDAAAQMYFDMGCGVATGVISDEWQPDSTDERAGMIKAIAAYLRFKGTIDLTPGQALTFALVSYAGKRLNKPKTKERLTLWFLKLKGMFKKPEIKP